MEYVALLRGINVGGKNKVVMSELREQVAGVGYVGYRRKRGALDGVSWV